MSGMSEKSGIDLFEEFLEREVDSTTSSDDVTRSKESFNSLSAVKRESGRYGKYGGLETGVSSKGNTLLHLAIMHRLFELAGDLLRESSDGRGALLDLNKANAEGLTPFHLIAKNAEGPSGQNVQYWFLAPLKTAEI